MQTYILSAAALLMHESNEGQRLFVEATGEAGFATVVSLTSPTTHNPLLQLAALKCVLALSRSAAYLRRMQYAFSQSAACCLAFIAHRRHAAQIPQEFLRIACSILANLALSFSPSRASLSTTNPFPSGGRPVRPAFWNGMACHESHCLSHVQL